MGKAHLRMKQTWRRNRELRAKRVRYVMTPIKPWTEPYLQLVDSRILNYVLSCSVAKSCPALCHPMDCSLPGSPVHEILQARVLEWVAISFSTGSFQPRDQTQVSCTAGRSFTIWATREAHIRHNSNYEVFWKRQKYENNKRVVVAKVLKGGKMEMHRCSTGIF